MDAETMRELDSGIWATINPFTCPCGGSGWLLSEYDTWHRCSVHGKDAVPSNEDDPRDFTKDHLTKCARNAYMAFYNATKTTGLLPFLTPAKFEELCSGYIYGARNANGQDVTLKASVREWVDAAEMAAAHFTSETCEDEARREGFSCALEMNLANDAAREAADRK